MLGITIRKEILTYSLMIEGLTSSFLSGLLGIKDQKNSRTLGNKSSSLSFNNKIDLLIDIGALKGETKSKFQTFMEIRNQFMHNIEASNYENCFSFMPDKITFLLKQYPQAQNLTKEDQLKNATLELATDVFNFTGELTQRLREKFAKDAEAETLKKSNKALIESITEMTKNLNEIVEKEIEESPNFSSARLKGLGTQVGRHIFKIWKGKFEAR